MNFQDIKEKTIEFYQDNKVVVNVVLILLASILVLAIINTVLSNNGNEKPNDTNQVVTTNIVLFGDKLININEGEEYIDPGFYAITSEGEIVTDEVVVSNTVDTSKPGVYTITYKIDGKEVIRTVKVLEKENETITSPEEEDVSVLSFSLKGNSLVVINQGDIYQEPGYIATDTKDGNITNKVVVTGNVNTSVAGSYNLTYKVTNSQGMTKTLTRQIIVVTSTLAVNVTLNNTSYTNENVVATISVSGNNFSYIKFPDKTVSMNKTANYTISSNGNYEFYIYDKSNHYIVKTVTVNNIDKTPPTGSCTAKVEDGKTSISVVAHDDISGISSYDYYSGSSLLTTRTVNSYTYSKELSNVSVKLTDKTRNTKTIQCQVQYVKPKYNLEVHYIDVGREDAILIRSSEKVILIDGGSYGKKSIVTPYLQDLGIKKIDVMIGSHLHYNHIQAQADILENFTVDKIYYPQDLNTCYSAYCDTRDQKYILAAIKKYNKSISIMKVDDNITIGDMSIFCIGPIKFKTKSQNTYRQNYNSLNFILTYGETKFMFTGDYMQVSNILNRYDESELDIDVLKYPHHGNAGLGKTLVNAMSPKYTILTSSSDELSSRSEKTYLKNVGSSFYYSYKHDNILVISDGKNLSVKTEVNPSDYKR